jgi:hypothetical protein
MEKYLAVYHTKMEDKKFICHVQGSRAHGKDSLLCTRGTQRTAKPFFVCPFLQLINRVNVLGSKKLPQIRIRQYKLYIAYIKKF